MMITKKIGGMSHTLELGGARRIRRVWACHMAWLIWCQAEQPCLALSCDETRWFPGFLLLSVPSFGELY